MKKVLFFAALIAIAVSCATDNPGDEDATQKQHRLHSSDMIIDPTLDDFSLNDSTINILAQERFNMSAPLISHVYSSDFWPVFIELMPDLLTEEQNQALSNLLSFTVPEVALTILTENDTSLIVAPFIWNDNSILAQQYPYLLTPDMFNLVSMDNYSPLNTTNDFNTTIEELYQASARVGLPFDISDVKNFYTLYSNLAYQFFIEDFGRVEPAPCIYNDFNPITHPTYDNEILNLAAQSVCPQASNISSFAMALFKVLEYEGATLHRGSYRIQMINDSSNINSPLTAQDNCDYFELMHELHEDYDIDGEAVISGETASEYLQGRGLELVEANLYDALNFIRIFQKPIFIETDGRWSLLYEYDESEQPCLMFNQYKFNIDKCNALTATNYKTTKLSYSHLYIYNLTFVFVYGGSQ